MGNEKEAESRNGQRRLIGCYRPWNEDIGSLKDGKMLSVAGKTARQQGKTRRPQGKMLRKEGKTMQFHGKTRRHHGKTLSQEGKLRREEGKILQKEGKMFRNDGKIRRGDALSAQKDALPRRNHALLNQNSALPAQHYTLSAQNYALLNQNYALLNQNYALSTQKDALLSQNHALSTQKDALPRRRDALSPRARINTATKKCRGPFNERPILRHAAIQIPAESLARTSPVLLQRGTASRNGPSAPSCLRASVPSCLLLFFAFVLFVVPVFAHAASKPNFIVILGEGHGWSSTSVQMDDGVAQSRSASVRTPNFEKLAAGGMRLANFYAPSPRCTPSRATLFTGKSPAALHMTFIGEGKKETGAATNGKLITPVNSMELAENEVTIAELLKRAGYATAHFGKWHVGRIDPSRHGFDVSDGPTANGGPENVENPHPKELYGMTQRGIDFLAKQVKAGKPFYLQLSHYASRRGGDASPEALAEVKRWNLTGREQDISEAAATYDLDIAFGILLKKIDELGLAENTYILFTTDHGTPGKNPPLAGGKGTVSDGGLRVPFILRGPGIKAGACSHVRAVGADLFPTIAELAQVNEPLPPGLEGGSLVAVLKNGGVGNIKRPREEYIVHFPHYDKDALGPASAIYLGDFKLIRLYESNALRLYNITKDPAERQDLAKEMPDKVKDLDQRLSTYLSNIKAQMPTSNPNYDPTKPAPGPDDRKGKKK